MNPDSAAAAAYLLRRSKNGKEVTPTTTSYAIIRGSAVQTETHHVFVLDFFDCESTKCVVSENKKNGIAQWVFLEFGALFFSFFEDEK